MEADQADDFEKAILISFAQDGQVEESLKVVFPASIAFFFLCTMVSTMLCDW